jgi:hypothetical protein
VGEKRKNTDTWVPQKSLQNNPNEIYLSSVLPRQHWQWGPHVRNRVSQPKSNNQCTLEQIRAKPVVFCNFAEYRWFLVFPTQMWWFFGINSDVREGTLPPSLRCRPCPALILLYAGSISRSISYLPWPGLYHELVVMVTYRCRFQRPEDNALFKRIARNNSPMIKQWHTKGMSLCMV